MSDKAAATYHPSPSYTEAVSEAHRPNHTPIWEAIDGGRCCTLCGYIETQEPEP